MRLKLFRAASMAAAMALVRKELGEDAIILSSRRVAGGVEVTAGLDRDPDPPPPITPPAAVRAPGGDQERSLAWHGLPPALARRLEAGPLGFALAAALRFAPLALADGVPVLLVGPPGAGKTLTAARLATRLVLAGEVPVVLTADDHRAGAAEQLAAFTRLLGLDLLAASQPAALARALGQARGDANRAVLIDAPGTDPFQAGDLGAMHALATSVRGRIVAVLPAGLDAAESADMAEAYAAGGAVALIATRLDCARRLGGVVAAAAAGLPLAEFGIGPGAADGLVPATPSDLARRLAGDGASHQEHRA